MNTGLEMLMPIIYKWMNTLKVKQSRWGSGGNFSTKKAAQWVKDFKLVEWGSRGLFPEYLEMGNFMVLFLSLKITTSFCETLM